MRGWCVPFSLALVACGIPVHSRILEAPVFGSVGSPQNACERDAFIGAARTAASAEAVLPQRSQRQIGPTLIEYTQNDIHGGAVRVGYGLYRTGSDEPMKLSYGLRFVAPSMADSHDRSFAAGIRARLDRRSWWGTWAFVGLAVTVIGAGVAIGGVTTDAGGLLGPGLGVMTGGLVVTLVGTVGALSNRVMMSPSAVSEAVVDDVVSSHAGLPSLVDQYNAAVRTRCR
jgi:hypothetical protein